MPYFENEILRELLLGEFYTVRQLAIFSDNHQESMILSKSVRRFDLNNNEKLKVLEIFEGWLHCSIKGVLQTPSNKSKIYIVS